MSIVRIEMENGDVMRAELYPEIAPKTVENFINHVQAGTYNGTIFHRVIPGFMIQGGEDASGKAHTPIEGEFTENGFENNLEHDRGVLSMARTMDPNSASTQFFVMVAKSPHLDGKYAAFGKVIEGIEAADTIVNQKRDMRDKPKNDMVMVKVEMEPEEEK